MNVMVIAPHPDDEAIGCGGSLCLHAECGDRVVAVFLTSGELGLKRLAPAKAWEIREGEAMRSARILGIAQLHFLRQPDWYLGDSIAEAAATLYPILKTEAPGLVYVPHPVEWHPDHRASLLILRRALKRAKVRKAELRGYEVWTPMSEYDHVADISQVMARKLRALRAHRSQLDEFDYARAVRGLNQYRGALAGNCAYAEAFRTL